MTEEEKQAVLGKSWSRAVARQHREGQAARPEEVVLPPSVMHQHPYRGGPTASVQVRDPYVFHPVRRFGAMLLGVLVRLFT